MGRGLSGRAWHAAAVTQLSHLLLDDFTPGGALRTLILLTATWWFWVYTVWFSNWFDPEQVQVQVPVPVPVPVRVLLLVCLTLSALVPTAFGADGLLFAVLLCVAIAGLLGFAVWGLHGAAPTNERNYRRILIWAAFSWPFWLLGGGLGGAAQVWFWVAALVIGLAGVALRFCLPRLGASATRDWDIDPGHMAERCGLFVLIALGESIVAIGATVATVAESERSAGLLAGFVVAFIISAGLWWVYFETSAARANRRLSAIADPGRLGRDACSYVHQLIVGGIILVAVGDELALDEPRGELTTALLLTLLGGPALFLLGSGVFQALTTPDGIPRSHLVALVVLATAWPVAVVADFDALGLMIAVAAVLVSVAVRESRRPDPAFDGG